MRIIIAEIKKKIKQHESLQTSAFPENSVWKRAQYIILAEIITQKLSQSPHLEGNRKYELGTTISYITLQRLFEDKYNDSAVNDLRFLKTLHKLCIFLDYYDLNEFILTSNAIKILKKEDKDANTYKDIVKNLCITEFDLIRNLPNIDIERLYHYAFKDSSTIKQIEAYLSKYKEAQYIFDSNYPEANFEMVSCDLLADQKDYKIIKTVENWDFVLKNKGENKTIYYKVFNSQTYYLKKNKKGVWKIWNNYNPNTQRLKRKFF